MRSFRIPLLAAVVAFAAGSQAFAQTATLPNGVALTTASGRLEVTALRDDVIRVRFGRDGRMPEDASWAVVPIAHGSSITVKELHTAETIGFRTKSLTIEIAKTDGRLTVRDASGKVVQKDELPMLLEAHGFRIYKQMPLDEHYFGLGDRTGPLDRREEAFSFWNTDAYRFQESTDPLYKTLPFFLTYRAGVSVGIFLDNTWRSEFDFGKQKAGVYSFGAADGPIDYYILYGPSPRQVVEDYAWLTGKPPLPPLWSLGFQQSRYSYPNRARFLEVASKLREDRIPADALYLDIGFQDRNRPFTVNEKLFPDFAQMIAQLKQQNFHVVTITDLHIAKAPGQNYAPYDSGNAGDHFVKNPDGSVYFGRVWPGDSVFPDFTQQQTRAWWGTLYERFHKDGVEGFWNDMNEPSVFSEPTKTMPVDVVHRIDEPGFAKRTATHAELHNVYGMQNSRATYEGLKTIAPDERPFVLTRASYAGGQRYAATWTGDNSSSWNHLRLATPMLENLGLSGFAFAGADVGGYAGTPSMELLTKWIEIAAFQPIDRDHTEDGTADQEPWVGGPEQEAIRRRFIETRYKLMPYLYTLADEASRTGLPMVRPLFLDYPQAAPDGHPLDVDPDAGSEFLLGHDLLIAPPAYPDELDRYTAELPSPDWYDFWTGEKLAQPNGRQHQAGETISGPPPIPLTAVLTPELDKLPVFVRGGAILPMAPLVQSTNEIPKGPLTLRIYAGPDCRGSVYTDDGKSFAYEHGEYLRQEFRCDVGTDALHLHMSKPEGRYQPWWKTIRVEVYGWKPNAKDVEVDGHRASATANDIEHGFAFELPRGEGQTEITFR